MIRKNPINCKLIELKSSKKSGFDVFNETIEGFREEEEVCPTCGRKGDCKVFASYKRYLIDFESGKPQVREIEIPRVICSCGSSHAILPDPIIPYNQYSLFYILVVLAVYSCHILTVGHICELYAISPSMLYRWKKIYLDQRQDWQGLLKSTTTDIRHSLLALCRRDPHSAFSIFFIQTTSFSFLQTHANPANCQRNLQYAYKSEACHTT